MPPRFRIRAPHLVDLAGALDSPTVVFAAGHSGAGTRWAAELAGALPDSWGVCALLLPGRESLHHAPFAAHIVGVASTIANDIIATETRDRSILLYGQSLGALVAFEVCRVLERSAVGRMLGLVVLGAPAPRTRPARMVAALTDDELVGELRGYGSTAEAVLEDTGLRERILAVVRSDMRLFDEFHWETDATVNVPIAALRGADDATVSAEAMRQWKDCTRSPHFAFAEVPGGHLPTETAVPHWTALIEGFLSASGEHPHSAADLARDRS